MSKWDFQNVPVNTLAEDQRKFWASFSYGGALPFDHMPAGQIYDQYWKGAILNEGPNYMGIQRRKFFEVVPVAVTIPTELIGRDYTFSVNRDFEAALLGTAEVRVAKPGAYMPEHWLGRHGMKVFEQLHGNGLAHSIEVHDGDTMIGGVIGLSNGGAFLSMDPFRFTDKPLAAAATFLALQAVLANGGFAWHETATPSLVSRDFGGELVPAQTAAAARTAAIEAARGVIEPLEDRVSILAYAGTVSRRVRRSVIEASRPSM